MVLHYACAQVITDDDLSGCDCTLDKISPALSDAEVTLILEAACDALANITGLPIGRCETVYRPCQDYCHYFGCPCGCGPSGIPLPGILPVVKQVKISGVVVNPNTYTVIRGHGQPSLERFTLAGLPDVWPTQQNVAVPDTFPDTFAVTVESGFYPDTIMREAAAEIACDILSTLAHLRETADGVQTASVYGVTQSYTRFGSPTDQQTMTLAGLGQVRRFVAAAGAISYSAFVSNDLKRSWKLYTRG